MVEVFSAGNDGDGNGNPADPKGDEGYGSITSPGTAKNVITVGASENVRTLGHGRLRRHERAAPTTRATSSTSPAAGPPDGRMKPDLVAPGTHIGAPRRSTPATPAPGCATRPSPAATFYSLVSGTSQATPHVAGAAALLRDWYVRHVDRAAAVAGA